MAPLFLIFLLLQSSFGYIVDEIYPPENAEFYPEETPTSENELEIHRRTPNNNFLRFGRNNVDNPNPEYEDYDDFARPTRSGKLEKNDHFIRFGRNKQDFLRFGRDPHRVAARDRSGYLRFGRSLHENKRNKREALFNEDNYKRNAAGGGGSNFLRFGRNSNFMRFGRNHPDLLSLPTAAGNLGQNDEILKQLHDSPIVYLLNELLTNQENKKCALRDA